MSAKRFGVALLALALVAVGCRNQQTGVAAADYEKQRAEIIARRQAAKQAGPVQQVTQRSGQPATGAAPRAGLGSGSMEATYDPSGKRDPFRSFVLDRLKELASRTKGPLEQFDVGQLTLHGVVWETNRPRALVADPSGQVYIVREGDPIGTNQGSVVSIDDNLMKVRETYVDHMGEPTTKETDMRVRRNQEG